MALRFYNTLTRTLEPFEPLEPGRVRIYACGPTVYQRPHIGNYRTFLFNDLLHRYLEWSGYEVRFVMNLTDVDDKIIRNAREKGVSIAEFAEPYIEAFLGELDTLGVRRADVFPRATQHIEDMIALVSSLVERGHGYVAEDGSVYFDISSFDGYGKLSRIPLDQMRKGERVADDEYEKDDARDFALWKAAKDEDREVGAVWPTPWGDGRPGWHLECSAMSMAELGETFDIHTGGEDLVFPHHEDEIAQSEGATGKAFVRFWLHARHLMMRDQKMSKSLGNVVRLADLLDLGWAPVEIRYFLLSAQYRNELGFSEDALADARAAVRRIIALRDRLKDAEGTDDAPDAGLPAIAERFLSAFTIALDDDLNTPAALGALFTFVRETHGALDAAGAVSAAALDAARNALARADEVLGVLQLADRDSGVDDELAAWVEERIQARQDARKRKDFAAADAIRDELAEAGIEVEDTPKGPRWKKR